MSVKASSQTKEGLNVRMLGYFRHEVAWRRPRGCKLGHDGNEASNDQIDHGKGYAGADGGEDTD